jgi:hypothetical protein
MLDGEQQVVPAAEPGDDFIARVVEGFLQPCKAATVVVDQHDPHARLRIDPARHPATSCHPNMTARIA